MIGGAGRGTQLEWVQRMVSTDGATGVGSATEGLGQPLRVLYAQYQAVMERLAGSQ